MPLLICDDDKHICDELKALTTALGFQTLSFTSAAQLQLALKSTPTPQAVLLDLVMPDCDGLALLRALLPLGLPIIALTSAKNEEAGLNAVRLGARDYLVKPLNIARVEVALRQLIVSPLTQTEIIGADFIATSPRLKTLLASAQKAMLSSAPLLIEGEKGTGKSLFAHCLVQLSPRSFNGSLTQDGAQLTPEALETSFMKAAQGTLIIENTQDLSLKTQESLLKLLHASAKKSAKLIFISSAPLLTCVKQGQFREELYYHLAIHPLSLPHFRSEKEDFKAIATHFHSQALREFGGKSLHSNPETLWHDENITCNQSLKAAITRQLLLQNTPHLMLYNHEGLRPLAALEADIYARALHDYKGQMSEIARKLGIGRTTLYRKLVEFGLVAPLKTAA